MNVKLIPIDVEHLGRYSAGLLQMQYSSAQEVYERSQVVRDRSVPMFDIPVPDESHEYNPDTKPVWDEWDLEDFYREYWSRFEPFNIGSLVRTAKKETSTSRT